MSPPLSHPALNTELKDNNTWLLNSLSSLNDPVDLFPINQNLSGNFSFDDQSLKWTSSIAPSSGQTEDDEPLTIPIGHLTPTSSLFTLEPIRRLVGDYPEDYFLQIEEARYFQPATFAGILAEGLASLDIDRSDSETYMSAFLLHVHPQFPIVDPDSFTTLYRRVMNDGDHSDDLDDLDVALCLVIMALGKLISNRQACSPGHCSRDDGSDYFALAYNILTSRCISTFGFNLSLASGLVHSAIYMCYLERPLHAWRFTHMASTQVQMMLPSDSLAEFHLPRSGIELIIDNMPFPQFSSSGDHDGLNFLAICSIRRLLNRIHRAIYAKQPSKGTQSMGIGANSGWTLQQPSVFFSVEALGSVCAELDRQLDAWYESLPIDIRPDLSETVPVNSHDGWLRLRYWSAKHIICRPCLVYATELTDHAHLPAYVLENSEKCVESCRNYIHTASIILTERTQWTFMTIQGLVIGRDEIIKFCSKY
ncbi:unnamed protein product [Clonostachys byssicola]|uniref:Xylanolytic transcriptional activator regulatory domain-containing protein n=1 Tax=Clonostachys byssicola TaxID=160290 RepID=A0A9N9UNC6_9HYPO|nr:unnamed protein product [Clonostachys byssicola]